MDSKSTIFAITQIGLLVSPFFALMLFLLFRENRKFIISFVCILALLWIFSYSGITFKQDSLDLILPIGIFVFYCFMLYHAIFIYNNFLRIIIFIIGFIPILVAIVFVITGYSAEIPGKVATLGNQYYYKEYQYGSAISESGTRIEIHKTVRRFPFIEKRILIKDLNIPEYDTDSISIKFKETPQKFKIEIYSKDKLQVDTIIDK